MKQSLTNYKALPFLIMLYITLMLAANVVIYKLILIGGLIVSVGSFIIPCVHLLIDIISERYGYQIAKKIIFYGLVCQLIFTVICCTLISIPSPSFWTYQDSYNQVLGKLSTIFVGSFLGTSIGMFINARLISKWKILIKGRYFWLRSLGSSALGQLLFTIITLSYDMSGIQPINNIISIIVTSYSIKLIFTIIFSTPAALAVAFLKIYDKTPDLEENINPFLEASKKIISSKLNLSSSL